MWSFFCNLKLIYFFSAGLTPLFWFYICYSLTPHLHILKQYCPIDALALETSYCLWFLCACIKDLHLISANTNKPCKLYIWMLVWTVELLLCSWRSLTSTVLLVQQQHVLLSNQCVAYLTMSPCLLWTYLSLLYSFISKCSCHGTEEWSQGQSIAGSVWKTCVLDVKCSHLVTQKFEVV